MCKAARGTLLAEPSPHYALDVARPERVAWQAGSGRGATTGAEPAEPKMNGQTPAAVEARCSRAAGIALGRAYLPASCTIAWARVSKSKRCFF